MDISTVRRFYTAWAESTHSQNLIDDTIYWQNPFKIEGNMSKQIL